VLTDWTEAWGPVHFWFSRIEHQHVQGALRQGTLLEYKASFVDFVEQMRRRVVGLRLGNLASVDLGSVKDSAELIEAWRQVLHLTEEVVLRLATADAIIGICF
jgi:hypothetical protein